VEAVNKASGPSWALWCIVPVLAACETAWLYDARPGINWAMATVSFVAGVLICWARAGKSLRLNVLVPLLLACFISGASAVTADPGNEMLVAAAVLFALGSAVVAAGTYFDRTDGPLRRVVAAPYAIVLVASETRGRFDQTWGVVRGGEAVGAIRGIALAVPVTVVLALLLSEADPTFATARDLIVNALQDRSILPRGLFFLVLSACMVGAFGIALQAKSARPPRSIARIMPARQVFGDTERLIVLGSVATLFALFLVLQVSYLFGDPGGHSGSGVSYADAVHRGFAELNVASTVCGVLLFTLRRHAASQQPGRWLRALELIVTVQAQILLWSAFYRVSLYEGAYGFTRLRLYVQVYAVVAFIALIFLVIELDGPPVLDRFVRRVMVVAALVLGALIWGNSDAWIAHANLLRYARTGRIDVEYLTRGLGPDAVPELAGSLTQLPAPLATRLAVCLDHRYPEGPDKDVRWFEWSLRRAALNRALTELRTRNAVAGQLESSAGSC
jgi:hypothetical protein